MAQTEIATLTWKAMCDCFTSQECCAYGVKDGKNINYNK